MQILEKIKNKISLAINETIENAEIQVRDLNYPVERKMGDLSLACFSLAKILSQNPADIARDLAEKLKSRKAEINCSVVEAVGPYLNFRLDHETLISETLENILKQKEKYGQSDILAGKRIMVEYAHPNPFKAFHIGHLRNAILGRTICDLLESQGAEVIRVNYQGDVGMHIAKCLWSLSKINPEDYPESIDDKIKLITRSYAEGASAFKEDEVAQAEIREINKKIYSREDAKINKLWELGKKWSLDKFHVIFARLGVRFEREYMESETLELAQDKIKEGIRKGVFKESEGAIILPGEKHGVDTRVFLSSEKLPTYEGKEMGLAFMEFSDFGEIDLCIHNVAVEQISFFKTTFKAQELLDPELFRGKQYHHAYEFVGLKKGKMSSRSGNVVLGEEILDLACEKIYKKICEREELEKKDLENLAEKIGVSAVQYSFLQISPKKYLAFDMEASISFEGNSAPYLQYTYVRIKSILEKANFDVQNAKIQTQNLSQDLEYEIILKLAKYGEVVRDAARDYDPSELCKYLFELAQIFNDYYHKHSILKVEQDIQEARLILLECVRQVLENGFGILGIQIVEKM